jgi:hypothetical protein
MIERASEMELSEALRTLLFEPLRIEGVFVAKSSGDLRATAWGNENDYDPGWVYHGLMVGSPFAAASFLHRFIFGPFLAQNLKDEFLNPMSVGGSLLTQNRKSRPGISREGGVGCGLLRTTRRTGDGEEGTQRGADSACLAAG